jgi:peroxiredoxin
LRRFEAMQADLDEHGVALIALSKDSVEEAATHKTRDGLKMTLLADPKLEVIRRYGVEHHKALGFNTGSFTLFGIPLALTPSFKTMAIPTSLLVDEHGVIRWIDQADDYRLRSSNDRVLQAVREVFA